MMNDGYLSLAPFKSKKVTVSQIHSSTSDSTKLSFLKNCETISMKKLKVLVKKLDKNDKVLDQCQNKAEIIKHLDIETKNKVSRTSPYYNRYSPLIIRQ